MSEKNFVQNFKANFFEYTNEKCTGQTKGQKVFLYKKKCIPNYHIGTSIAMQLLVLKKMLLRHIYCFYSLNFCVGESYFLEENKN
jgi:hypothetical protein